MHIHILGICGTFMAGIAKLAKELGYTVTGSDQQVYPPMSDVLASMGIAINEGYTENSVPASADMVVIGNAMSRGNPAVEAVLNKKIPYISGPQWLYEHVLKTKHVLAVSGTHGKTTTTSLLAWILESAGLKPGFLIGGVPKNFEETTRLGGSDYFVIEADEYDTAFYDKRSKFLHYRPQTLIINNLEFDHADIFDDLAAIQKQFQYLLRTVPSSGSVIFPANCQAITGVIARGCWAKQVPLQENAGWHAKALSPDRSQFEIYSETGEKIQINWSLIGDHNMQNALAAAAAARQVGVTLADIQKGINTFSGVKRRLEVRGNVNGVTVYDDFAHHPSAIETTLKGLRAKVGNERIFVVAQLASNTMEMGVHQNTLGCAFALADEVHIWHPANSKWQIDPVLKPLNGKGFSHLTVDDIIQNVKSSVKPHDHVLVMSNKGFEGIHTRLLAAL